MGENGMKEELERAMEAAGTSCPLMSEDPLLKM